MDQHGPTRYFFALPPELRHLLCCFFSKELLDRVSVSDDTLAGWPEFVVLTTEPFWRELFRREYSTHQYSDGFPIAGVDNWRLCYTAVAHNRGSANTAYTFTRLVKFGCEIPCRKMLQDPASIQTISEALSLRKVLTALGSSASLEIFQLIEETVFSRQHCEFRPADASDLFNNEHSTSRHSREKIELIGYIWRKYPSSDMLAELAQQIAERFTMADFSKHITPSIAPHRDSLHEIVGWCADPGVNNVSLFKYLCGLADGLQAQVDFTFLLSEATDHEIITLCCEWGADGRAGNYAALRGALVRNDLRSAKYLLQRFPIL